MLNKILNTISRVTGKILDEEVKVGPHINEYDEKITCKSEFNPYRHKMETINISKREYILEELTKKIKPLIEVNKSSSGNNYVRELSIRGLDIGTVSSKYTNQYDSYYRDQLKFRLLKSQEPHPTRDSVVIYAEKLLKLINDVLEINDVTTLAHLKYTSTDGICENFKRLLEISDGISNEILDEKTRLKELEEKERKSRIELANKAIYSDSDILLQSFSTLERDWQIEEELIDG